MKVIFRCKRSGNTVSFSNPNDIEQLRKHEGYEEVKNADGRAQTEDVTGASAGTATSTKYFKTVTGIAHTGSVATTLTSGNTIDAVSNTVRPNLNTSPIAIGIGIVLVSGTATYKVQHSYQDGTSSHPTLWFDNTAGAKTASSEATYSTPVATIRLLISASASGLLSGNIVQAG
ncbi:MAG: hypothetical protein UW55_C0024G0015 [Candidatus Giovannonibacteria bacterium GW2011_GWA2_44_26]|uniref:Uncharacterized protein n=1 Tax=Candidatus Giovannonibacteria bacterium GW2011_GWA2_44_26 TaxID=1618648 RepID=A0A0G1IS56_9BACT|nr:MAG: hypothetical protein UW55_C0024G0015 [Candidatus Giovannonibacteria bacterium GW2011_GWA2_44_26]